MPHDGMERYELVELLGRGPATEVHRAHDHTLDRPVAVKVFAAPLDEAAERRFDHEARALARLSHPGLVSLFDVGVVVSRPYLVMQLVEGESLASRLLSGPLPLADTLRIGDVLADALAHAHSRGVVHRDVKPSNILLDGENMPHLTDFGIALLTGTNRLTSTNEIIGTPAYLAPEQILGAEVGPAADVYALGLVLLECLKGDMEYSGGTRLEAALARLHRRPVIPATLPAGIAELLRSMTAAEPGSRPSAEECARRLRSTDDTPLALGDWQPAPATRAGRRRIAAAAATTLAVACAGVVLALNTPQP
ncbi:MAG TPA: serine/threonine-protein kinase, partial [Pseudonocardiaceae bacterium]|nr:serine/threonine-protein kinase [Pseudonocardiaceae bacterium]